YASQKNAAFELASRGWIFSIDADEVMDDALRDAIIATLRRPTNAGYKVTRRLHFMGRPMRYGKTTDHPLRLVRKGSGSFASRIHEVLQVNGSVGQLAGTLTHYSYADISDYFRRFNTYTSIVAANHLAAGKKMSLTAHLMRPWFEFVNRYFLRL